MSSDIQFTDIKDALEKAQILINEELYQDAKKILYKVLSINIDQSEAKALLNEIQKIEINLLLSDPKNENKNFKKDFIHKDDVIFQLQKKLNISLTEAVDSKKDGIEKIIKSTSKYLNKYNDREKLDLAIAFYEMEIYEATIDILEKIKNNSKFYLSAFLIICKTLIVSNRAIEAVVKLEPFIKRNDLNENDRCSVYYMMGLAFEKLEDIKRANEYYRHVYQLNSKFKDVADKIK